MSDHRAARRTRVAITLAAAAAVALGTPATAPADDPPTASSSSTTSPGPPLWRVTRGDHELFLFGTVSAVPREMKWRSPAAERAIASAEEILLPPGVRAAVTLRPVQLVRAWARAREMSRSPNDLELAQVMPPDLYRRYATLRDRYGRRSRSLEHQRPILSAARVYNDALDHLGLVSGRDLQTAIERLARRAHVAPTDTQLHVDPDELLDEAARVTLPAELDCVGKILDATEHAHERIAARARAWARGDVAALRRFEYADIREECLAFPGWPDGLRATLTAAEEKWFAEAERALKTNRTTFGAIDLRELIADDGLLARFRERGYDVREP